jgi:hypothetical protein
MPKGKGRQSSKKGRAAAAGPAADQANPPLPLIVAPQQLPSGWEDRGNIMPPRGSQARGANSVENPIGPAPAEPPRRTTPEVRPVRAATADGSGNGIGDYGSGSADGSGYGIGNYGSDPYGGEQIGIGEIVDSVGNVVGGVDQSGNITGPPRHTFVELGSSLGGGEGPAETYSVSPFIPGSAEHRISRIATDYPALLSLARVYERMARDGIDKLDSERPNDPERAEANSRQRDLLTILADGFARIAAALEAVTREPRQPLLLGKASEVVREFGEQLTAWWKKNATEAVDWAIRIPAFAGSLPLLAWAGADMTIATAAMGAMVGGEKVVAVLTRGRRGKPKKKK